MTTNNSINNTTPGLNVVGSSSGTVSILPQAAAGTYNFNLPTTAGTAGQQLTSAGGGGAAMTWASASGAGFTTINVQTFTSNGTYTPTASMKYCIVRLVGGGGGSSSVPITSTGSGAGGGYAEGLFSAATIGASQAVTIGAGGAGSTAGAGTSGGTTSVGALMSATGGQGGQTGANAAGGTGTGGYLSINGQAGVFSAPTLPPLYGGNSQLGQGGAANQGAGSPPVGYGAGGQVGGGSVTAGTSGIVIVTEYI